jgi:phosphonate transport system substrate-binding protein
MGLIMKLKILLVQSPFKKPHLFLGFMIAAILMLSRGCGGDTDVVVIDFSKTVDVERPGDRSTEDSSLRVAVAAMISPQETFIYYRQILDYIGRKLGREIELVQRKTYGEINELIGRGQIDLAFICSGPYVTGREKYGLELLATPQVQGSHFYQAYLIVNKDSPFHRFKDLKGRVFAFTDPDSNTGKLVPTYWLAQMGEQPETFFDKAIYTYSHDNSILAVARALVDGASVDGLIWEYYHHKDPTFTSKTRIIQKSEPYGIPPLVVSKYLPQELKEGMSKLLFSMHQNLEGKRILQKLMIDRFIAPNDVWYDSIQRMKHNVSLLKDKTHANAKS